MDKLPVEILTKIIDSETKTLYYHTDQSVGNIDLNPREQVKLQLVSRKFFELSRDNLLWRLHCYESSGKANGNGFTPAHISGARPLSSITPLSTLGPRTLRTLIQPHPQNISGVNNSHDYALPSIGQRSRAAAEWDPSYETEDVDWYSEYIARNGPISFSWTQRPVTGGPNRMLRDAMGMGLLRDWSFAREDRVIAPLDDGTICVWDMNYSHSNSANSLKGKITGMSRPGVLMTDMSKRSDKTPPRSPPLEFLNVGECVSVDSMRRRAYIAVGNILNEVDLETLHVVHQQRYAWSIFALSQETDYSVPLTLATTLSLQIYDARLSSPEEEAEISLRSIPIVRSYSYSQTDNHLNAFEALVRIRKVRIMRRCFNLGLCRYYILRLRMLIPSFWQEDFLVFSVTTGALFPGYKLPFTLEVGKHTIVACGEYNGRGSLELYDLNFHGSDPQHEDSESHMQSARYQNRQSAASSKLLSVASHGARIVFSDSNGNVKWVERDGQTQVRHWNINTSRRQSRIASPGDVDESDQVRGLFFTSDTSMRNDVVRKILPTDANLNGDELLLWSGDRIGRLRFSNDSDEGTDDEMNDWMSLDGEEADITEKQARRQSKELEKRREQEYAQRIRRALERQADETEYGITNPGFIGSLYRTPAAIYSKRSLLNIHQRRYINKYLKIRKQRHIRSPWNNYTSIISIMPSFTEDNLTFDPVEDAVAAFRNGQFVIVLDSTDRENEGDLIIAADAVTESQMAFLVRYSSGYVCAPILPSHADKLLLPQMVINNADPLITAYTISIDSNDASVTTGISAYDRALTCRQLADPNIKAENFRRPGHILPLRAREGGVRERKGHTEAAIDLCRLAGRSLAGVIGELVEEGEVVDGVAEVRGNNGMMRRDACLKFGRRFGIKVTTIEDMVAYLEKVDPHGRFDFVNGKA
ncbi:uncharacterized protein BHQ10_004950 [Talaromyces amestolkiae]|uniref:3,4-dihydroxy-2-butanone 4-phosphate synthase n=1 Tax=Talaromyces amestolkiae TaxID=1196081 RepID=A0A364KZG9_TALAM|nr:uncharacterized protein BHQ10_004950 [Talaromyces amestolkiae]RAO68938.1 hypothetical protein BHQ10_004950 [Talaromyces amestolkiae]